MKAQNLKEATHKPLHLNLKTSAQEIEDDIDLLQEFVDNECEKINTWHANTTNLRKKLLGDTKLPEKFLEKQSMILNRFAAETEKARTTCYAEYSGMIAEAVQDSGDIRNVFANLLTQMMMNSSAGTPNCTFMSLAQLTPTRSVIKPERSTEHQEQIDKQAEKNHFNRLLQRDLLADDEPVQKKAVSNTGAIQKEKTIMKNRGVSNAELLGKRPEVHVIDTTPTKSKEDDFEELSTASRVAKPSTMVTEASESEPSRQTISKSMMEKFSHALNSEDSLSSKVSAGTKKAGATAGVPQTAGVTAGQKKAVAAASQSGQISATSGNAKPPTATSIPIKALAPSSAYTPAPYEQSKPATCVPQPRELHSFRVTATEAKQDLREAKYLLPWPRGKWTAVVDDECLYRFEHGSLKRLELLDADRGKEPERGLFGLRSKIKKIVAAAEKSGAATTGASAVVKVRGGVIYVGYGDSVYELTAEDETVEEQDNQVLEANLTKQLDVAKGLYDFDVFRFHEEKITAYLSTAVENLLMIESSDPNTQVVEKDLMLCYKSAEVGEYKTKFRKVLLLNESLVLVAATRVHLKDSHEQYIDLHLFQFSQAKCKHKYTESIRFQKTSVTIDVDLLAVWAMAESAEEKCVVACIDHENNKVGYFAVSLEKKTLAHVGEDERLWPETPYLSLLSDNEHGEYLAIEAGEDSEDGHGDSDTPVLLYHIPAETPSATK